MDFSRGDTPLMFAFSLLSILACVPMVVSFSIFTHLRQKDYMRVVLYLAISNLLNNIGSLPGLPYDQSFACWFQAIVTNLFTLSALFWSIVITFMIHRIVFIGKIPAIDWRHHLLCWGLPCVVTFLAFINTTYGAPDGMGWCWVVALPSTTPWALLFWYWETFYFWLTCGVFAMIVMCIHIIYHIRNIHSATQHALMKVVNSVKYYPVIIAVCWGGQLIYDNVSTYTTFPGIEIVNTFSLTISCAQGFFTATLFFVSNRDVRNCWYELLTTGRYVDPAERSRRRWSLGGPSSNNTDTMTKKNQSSMRSAMMEAVSVKVYPEDQAAVNDPSAKDTIAESKSSISSNRIVSTGSALVTTDAQTDVAVTLFASQDIEVGVSGAATSTKGWNMSSTEKYSDSQGGACSDEVQRMDEEGQAVDGFFTRSHTSFSPPPAVQLPPLEVAAMKNSSMGIGGNGSNKGSHSSSSSSSRLNVAGAAVDDGLVLEEGDELFS